jgi:uncharacterized membrane protein YcaP (DUF421 family)
MFFDSWQGLLRVLLVGIPAYAALILLLRASGKRTLSKMNAFDLVVTVSLGSTLASILTSKDVALVEGVLALTLLILLQFAVTWTSVRSKKFNRLVKAEPTLLVYQGEPLHRVMKRERVNHDEILAALRKNNLSALEDATAVILESDATLTVVPRSAINAPANLSALQGVEGLPQEANTQPTDARNRAANARSA